MERQEQNIISAANPEEGGILMRILWSTSILRLEQEVKEHRRMLETEFDRQIRLHPEDDGIARKKEKCLKQFDEANKDTMSNVAKARKFFTGNPEFAGLIIPGKTTADKNYWDSFDCQVQCEEAYDERGLSYMTHKTGEYAPFE